MTDAGVPEATSLQLQQYPVKFEIEHVEMSNNSSDAFDHYQQQQQQHDAVLDEPASVSLISGVPSTIAVAMSQSLLSHDDSVLSQRQDAVAAAGRNVTPVKCTSLLLSHFSRQTLVNKLV